MLSERTHQVGSLFSPEEDVWAPLSGALWEGVTASRWWTHRAKGSCFVSVSTTSVRYGSGGLKRRGKGRDGGCTAFVEAKPRQPLKIAL